MADDKQESSRDGLALIVGGIFILALVFAAYNYFNKESGTPGITEEAASTNSVIDRIKEAINPSKDDLGTGGTIDDGMADVNVAGDSEYSMWVATDYVEGDISGGTYTVKNGDTLWEISEAVYGSGFEWNKLLEANSSSVDFLPNGEQALIMTGQVLIIP